MEFKFQMLEIVKDKVSGYQGVVMVRSEFSTGCAHYGVASQSLTSEGKVKDWEYFDESRLISVGHLNEIKTKKEKEKHPSGPFQNPPRSLER